MPQMHSNVLNTNTWWEKRRLRRGPTLQVPKSAVFQRLQLGHGQFQGSIHHLLCKVCVKEHAVSSTLCAAFSSKVSSVFLHTSHLLDCFFSDYTTSVAELLAEISPYDELSQANYFH